MDNVVQNKEVGYLPEFQSLPIKTHYEKIGFFDTLDDGLKALAKARPKNAVKFLGNWLVENDKGLTVKPIARGSLFDFGDTGGYRATVDEKRKQRTRERFMPNKNSNSENIGRTLVIKKQVNNNLNLSKGNSKERQQNLSKGNSKEKQEKLSKGSSKEKQDKVSKEESRASSKKGEKNSAKNLDISNEISGLDSIQEEVVEGSNSDNEQATKAKKNVSFKEDNTYDYSNSKHLISNDDPLAISESINTSKKYGDVL